MGTYRLGVDLGTTYSAAAVLREGREAPEMARIDGDPVVPSVVFLTEDGDELVGAVAEARAWDDPSRTAREFKRRFGDPVPIIVGGASYSAQRLTAIVLARLVSEVAATEGGPPASVTLTHPANWGPYKTELFAQVPDLAGLTDAEVRFVPEPEAAAISYASERPVDVGDRIAVYDLGGGTFDAAVVERTAGGGFTVLGTPQGIEQLGGVDLDEVVLHHVQAALAGRFDGLDRSDPDVSEGFAHLRDDCRRAKELLSSDTVTTVRVNLPALLDRVRITRSEFEGLVRPTIIHTLATMDAALASAAVNPDDLTAVLLVGGSSRMPLVADLLGDHYGRPVVLDAHPKYAVAQGAALFEPTGNGKPGATPASPSVATAAAAATAIGAVDPAGSGGDEQSPAAAREEAVGEGTARDGAAGDATVDHQPARADGPTDDGAGGDGGVVPGAPTSPLPEGPPTEPSGRRPRAALAAVGLLLVAAVLGGGLWWLAFGDGSDDPEAAESFEPAVSVATTSTTGTSTSTTEPAPTTTEPAGPVFVQTDPDLITELVLGAWHEGRLEALDEFADPELVDALSRTAPTPGWERAGLQCAEVGATGTDTGWLCTFRVTDGRVGGVEVFAAADAGFDGDGLVAVDLEIESASVRPDRD